MAPWRERRAGFDSRSVLRFMHETGVQSIPIVVLIAVLVGVILVLQTAYQLQRYGQVHLVAGLVAVSVTRELGPLLTAILITGRVGAAFTAELGTMKVAEEILALEVMAVHPVGFLVAPRFLALVLMLPCLTMVADVTGMLGGFVTGTTVYSISPAAYIVSGYSLGPDEKCGVCDHYRHGGLLPCPHCRRGTRGRRPCHYGGSSDLDRAHHRGG